MRAVLFIYSVKFRAKSALALCWVVACATLLMPLAPRSSAQSTGGRIRGTITDTSGSSIAAAQIQLVNEATHATRDLQSGANGEYIFIEIPVGTYDLSVTITGFKKYERKGIVLDLNEVVSLDVALQVGGATETVEVTGAPPVVDTTSTQLGAVVNSRDATELPLNSRDTYQLLQLQPGVQSQIGNDLFYGSDKAGVVTVNGGRGRANNYSVNGGDGNDLFANLPAIQPSPDTIEEFRVITNSFDAEYGRNSGAVVNVVTKSGTNEYHGSAFEFFRNKDLNARGAYDPVRPASIQNQFGATFGGPIKKDKTFFFASFEGRHAKKGISSFPVYVPSAAELSGDFSKYEPIGQPQVAATPFSGSIGTSTVADLLNSRPGCASAVANAGGAAIAVGTAYSQIFPNNQIPTACFDPISQALIANYVPAANVGTNGHQAAPNSFDNGNQFTIKVDHIINNNQKLAVYYYFDNDNALDPFAKFQASGADLGNFPGQTATRTQQVNVTHTWTIGATSVNEARFSYFREGQGKFNTPTVTGLVTDSCGSGMAAQYCFNGTSDASSVNAICAAGAATTADCGIHPNLGATKEGVPYISLNGGFSIGNNYEGQLPQVGNTYQISDNFSKIIGNHSLKFGADFRNQHFDQLLYYNVNGYFTFTGGGPNDVGANDQYPNFLLGLPNSYSQGSAQHELVRSKSVYLFAQDSWKIKPNVTFNYGLRWEVNTPLTDVGQKVQTFRPGQVSTVYPCQISQSDPLYATFGSDCNAAGVTPVGLVFPTDAGVPKGLTNTYYNGFAPRLGLNWSPGWHDGWLAKLTGGPSKTSVSMGYGIFYNPIEQLVLEQFSAEPPFGISNSISSPLFQTPFIDQSGNVYPNPANGILSPAKGPTDWAAFRPILLYGQFPKNLKLQYSDQYNLTIKRELPGNILFQIGYVGTQGHRLLANYQLNPGNPSTCLGLQAIANYYGQYESDGVTPNPNYNQTLNSDYTCGPFFEDSAFNLPANSIPAGYTLPLPYGSVASVSGPNPNPITLVGLRKYSSPLCQPTTGVGCPIDATPVFSGIFSQSTVAESNYNSMQVLVEKHYSHGLQLQAAYTWSKSLDNASSFEETLNPNNFRSTYGPSLYDARNRFVFSYVWELPAPKFDGIKGQLLDGWETSGILTLQSGFPIRITSSDDNELLDASTLFLNVGEPDLLNKFQTQNASKNGGYVFNGNQFNENVTLGTIGNSPRTLCCNPIINNWDMGVFKGFQLLERLRMEFRTEIYNVFNHTQFYSTDGNISDGPTFGQAQKVRDPREIQFAVKFIF